MVVSSCRVKGRLSRGVRFCSDKYGASSQTGGFFFFTGHGAHSPLVGEVADAPLECRGRLLLARCSGLFVRSTGHGAHAPSARSPTPHWSAAAGRRRHTEASSFEIARSACRGRLVAGPFAQDCLFDRRGTAL